ncbi:MAG: membrane protein insertion efficiency factor YidD [Mesorhizobium amorphae]|nr:MAG: membrane protein insertion efficiency factor YidD [Mesorhizobium amorphae]
MPRRVNRNWQGPWQKTPGRLAGTALVRFYQLTLSGFVGNGCRHYPTCSEYAYEALARHGLWAGGWLSLFRLSRCGPWGTHGVDLVPPTLDRGRTPWRLLGYGRHQG